MCNYYHPLNCRIFDSRYVIIFVNFEITFCMTLGGIINKLIITHIHCKGLVVFRIESLFGYNLSLLRN